MIAEEPQTPNKMHLFERARESCRSHAAMMPACSKSVETADAEAGPRRFAKPNMHPCKPARMHDYDSPTGSGLLAQQLCHGLGARQAAHLRYTVVFWRQAAAFRFFANLSKWCPEPVGQQGQQGQQQFLSEFLTPSPTKKRSDHYGPCTCTCTCTP